MLPLNDTEPNRYSYFPFMTVLLIVTNSFIFLVEVLIVRTDFWPFLMRYGVTPTLILDAQGGGVFGAQDLFADG